MFSGIVAAVGRVKRLDRSRDAATLEIDGGLEPTSLVLGESICTSGVCLTVRRITESGFVADLSSETLARTTLGAVSPGDVLNLERSLQVGDRIGGHFVFGHVDGIGEIRSLEPRGSSWSLRVGVPRAVAPFVVDKGSIAVDGISLTMCDCDADSFGVAVIPHTFESTNLVRRSAGERVNIEVDMLARYARKALESLPTLR